MNRLRVQSDRLHAFTRAKWLMGKPERVFNPRSTSSSNSQGWSIYFYVPCEHLNIWTFYFVRRIFILKRFLWSIILPLESILQFICVMCMSWWKRCEAKSEFCRASNVRVFSYWNKYIERNIVGQRNGDWIFLFEI